MKLKSGVCIFFGGSFGCFCSSGYLQLHTIFLAKEAAECHLWMFSNFGLQMAKFLLKNIKGVRRFLRMIQFKQANDYHSTLIKTKNGTRHWNRRKVRGEKNFHTFSHTPG